MNGQFCRQPNEICIRLVADIMIGYFLLLWLFSVVSSSNRSVSDAGQYLGVPCLACWTLRRPGTQEGEIITMHIWVSFPRTGIFAILGDFFEKI